MLISFDLHECHNIVGVAMMHRRLALANYVSLYIVCVAFERTLEKKRVCVITCHRYNEA